MSSFVISVFDKVEALYPNLNWSRDVSDWNGDYATLSCDIVCVSIINDKLMNVNVVEVNNKTDYFQTDTNSIGEIVDFIVCSIEEYCNLLLFK